MIVIMLMKIAQKIFSFVYLYMKIVVIAHVGSSQNTVKWDELHGQKIYRVYTSKKAVDWKANKAIIELLAAYFDVKKYHIELLNGHKWRKKLFEIL